MGKSVAYYLSKGCDQKTAEYFAKGRRRIINVVPNKNLTLTLTFDNKERRLYNVAPLIQNGTVFAPLTSSEIFQRVYLDENHCVAWDIDPSIDSNEIWNNKIDLSSDCCYMDSTPIDSNLYD